MKPWFPKADAILLLRGLLDNPDWMVRARAAECLFYLGNEAGIPILRNALVAGARNEPIPVMAVAIAASLLHAHRYEMDSHILFQCYARFRDPILLEFAALHQAPEVAAVIRERNEAGDSSYQTERLAMLAGMKDADTVQRYARLTTPTASALAQLLGHFGLYEATGNATDLDYVIGTLRECVGLEPSSERSAPWTHVKERAFDFLQLVVEPRSTATLEQIADWVAANPHGNSVDFARAFSPLTYIHHDYGFVDSRILSFLAGKYCGVGVDRDLMWKIAAARNTPAIESAARETGSEMYQRFFVAQPEILRRDGGIGLGAVPTSVVPPRTNAPPK